MVPLLLLSLLYCCPRPLSCDAPSDFSFVDARLSFWSSSGAFFCGLDRVIILLLRFFSGFREACVKERAAVRCSSFGRSSSVRVKLRKVEAMRTAAFFCRNVRRLSSMASQGSFGLVARPVVKNTLSRVGRMDASRNLLSSPVWCVESRGAGDALVQLISTSRVGALRFVGFGTFNEEHANAAVPDENEDEVKNDEHPEETIEKASQELFRQSNVIGDPEEPEVEVFQVKELLKENPSADIAHEIWSAKEQDGTSVFSDESDKVKSEA